MSWYSITSPSSSNNDDYCKYCLTNFKKFHDMINNVCQVCGRAAPKIIEDKQVHLQIKSLNSPRDNTMAKGVSTIIDTQSIFQRDETKDGMNLSDERVQVNSFREAIKWIHESDKSPSMMRNAVRDDYIIRTNKSGMFDKKAKLDERGR